MRLLSSLRVRTAPASTADLAETDWREIQNRMTRREDDLFAEELDQCFALTDAKRSGSAPPDLAASYPENQLLRALAGASLSAPSPAVAQARERVIEWTIEGVWGREAERLQALVDNVCRDLGLPTFDERSGDGATRQRARALTAGALDSVLRAPKPRWREARSEIRDLDLVILCEHIWAEIRDQDHRELIRSWRCEPVAGLARALRVAPRKIFDRAHIEEAASRRGALRVNLWRVGLREIGAWPTYRFFDDPEASPFGFPESAVSKSEVIKASYDQQAAEAWITTPWWRLRARRALERRARVAGVDFERLPQPILEFSTTELHRREMFRRGMAHTIRLTANKKTRKQPARFSVENL